MTSEYYASKLVLERLIRSRTFTSFSSRMRCKRSSSKPRPSECATAPITQHASPVMRNTINETKYLSVRRIADELGRNKVILYRFIQRHLRIQPAFTLNGYKYYTHAKIAKAMRRKNGCNGNGNAQ